MCPDFQVLGARGAGQMGKQKVVNSQGEPSRDIWQSKTVKCWRTTDKDLNVQWCDGWRVGVEQNQKETQSRAEQGVVSVLDEETTKGKMSGWES